MNKDTELKSVLSGGLEVEEVFYRTSHIGEVFQYPEDPIWYYRTKYSLMWWRATDKDDAVSQLITQSGIK